MIGEFGRRIIAEQDPFPADLLQQHLDLGPLKLNDLLLVPIDPAGKDDDEQLPGLKEDVHDSPDVDLESVRHPVRIGVCQPAGSGLRTTPVSSNTVAGCSPAQYFDPTGSSCCPSAKSD